MSRRYCLAYVEGDEMRAMQGDPARERPGVATWDTWEIEQVCALESRSYLVLGRDEPATQKPHAQGEQMLLILDGSRSERVIGPKADEYERHTDAGRLPLYSWRIDRIWPADHARAYALFSRGPIASPIVTGSVEIALESLPRGMIPASGLVVWSWSSLASVAPLSTARTCPTRDATIDATLYACTVDNPVRGSLEPLYGAAFIKTTFAAVAASEHAG